MVPPQMFQVPTLTLIEDGAQRNFVLAAASFYRGPSCPPQRRDEIHRHGMGPRSRSGALDVTIGSDWARPSETAK